MGDNIALFDLDGTLANYDAAMLRDLSALASPDEPEYSLYGALPEHVLRRKDVISRQEGWWLNLEKLTNGFDILEVCLEIGFAIHILTKGPDSKPQAWAEKLEWVRRNVRPLAPNAAITITQDKSLVYGKVLVDDFPPYMLGWLGHRPRGLGIMPLSEQNKDFTHHHVIIYDGTNLLDVRRKLEVAYKRQPYESLT